MGVPLILLCLFGILHIASQGALTFLCFFLSLLCALTSFIPCCFPHPFSLWVICLSCLTCSRTGQGDNEGHKAVGPCQAPPHYFHHHPEPPAHAGGGCRLFRVGILKSRNRNTQKVPHRDNEWFSVWSAPMRWYSWVLLQCYKWCRNFFFNLLLHTAARETETRTFHIDRSNNCMIYSE